MISNNKNIENIMLNMHIPGCSITFIDRFGDLVTENFGYASNSNDVISNETLFYGASLAKPVFATILLMLHKNGMIDLYKPINEYIETNELITNNLFSRISIQDILNHQSGIINQDIKSIDEFYGKFNYSNFGYLFLQNILSCAIPDFEETINDRLKLIGMNNSSFYPERIKSNLSKGFDPKMNVVSEFKEYPINFAHSLVTCSRDLGIFMKLLINSRIILKEICDNRNFVSVINQLYWSIGWGIQNIDSEISLWHSGSGFGYTSYIICFPERNMAISIMTNKENCFNFIYKILSIFMANGIHDLPSLKWILGIV